MSTLSISISDLAVPRLRALKALLNREDSAKLHDRMGQPVLRLITENFTTLQGQRKNKFGAPSTYFADAIKATSLQATAEAATITIAQVGITRALHDVTIRPKTAKTLAIPIDAIAYGRRAAALWEEKKLFFIKGKTTAGNAAGMIAMKDGDGKIRPLYLLLRSLTQKQDRTLLPATAEMENAAAAAADAYIGEAIQRAFGVPS